MLYRGSVRERQVRASVPSTTEVPTFTFITRSGFPPKHSRACYTPWSVFQDGSFKAITPTSQVLAYRIPQSQLTHTTRDYNTASCHISPAFVCQSKLMLACQQESTLGKSQAESPQTRLTSSVSLSTISRTVLLSFQSAFHLSLTVLVRYRSLANI